MVSLPYNSKLPIHSLAASFDNVTNSYKFYWFLAILEHIRENQSRTISTNDLLARMLASIWYPTNYFRLSFGKQDRLGQIALQVGEHSSLPMDAKRQHIISVVEKKVEENSALADEILSLAIYVPYRFLRPFFTQQLKGVKDWVVNGTVEQLAAESFDDLESPCLYRLINQPIIGIEIQPAWFEYLNRHLTILTGFCLWRLVNYVQKNNPNVPNVSNKLFEPEQRDMKRARAFWGLAFEELDHLACIYSGQAIYRENYSLDHFLPWRFVAHDLLWNIIPTPKNINSAKRDSLPDWERYFAPFAQLQYQAVQVVASSSKSSLLEDHILLLKTGSIEAIRSLTFKSFRETLQATLAPQFQIAANMGFVAQWSYYP